MAAASDEGGINVGVDRVGTSHRDTAHNFYCRSGFNLVLESLYRFRKSSLDCSYVHIPHPGADCVVYMGTERRIARKELVPLYVCRSAYFYVYLE